MKIVAMSDLHGTLLPVDTIEPCELVCICGDIVPLKYQANSYKTKSWLRNKFKPWCEELQCDKVIFIAGNHDFYVKDLEFMYSVFPKDKKVTYLFHEGYEYQSKDGKTYSIFGTPYCKIFGNWAFMDTDERLTELYEDIPENLDILLSHDQPHGYGDQLEIGSVPWADGSHIGNKPLLGTILKRQPNYLLCGHLHSTTHDCIEIGKTKRYNVSIKDERYDPVYDPLTLEI